MVEKIGFSRQIECALAELAQSFPIISITGPRQSGKTTLARRYFHDKQYFNLEDPSIRQQIVDDPKAILNAIDQHGAIFDEIQHFPDLLSYLQVMVDEQAYRGKFIITGSYNLALMESVSQSLAGRVGVLELLPMSTQELLQANIELSTDEYLYHGGLPRIFHDDINPSLVYKNYVKTYLERDMRQILQVKDLVQFQRFMQLCASRIGNEFVATRIANELGVTHHTVQHWLSVLEASYLVFRLSPYFENFGKRIIKSPKLYFTDVGLACYLLGIETVQQVQRDPLKGNLFENLVILDFYKQLLNRGREARIYYYRDKSQHEVDLLWQRGRDLIPIEIKYAETYKTDFTKNIKFLQQLAPERVSNAYVLYTGETRALSSTACQVLNYQRLADVIDRV